MYLILINLNQTATWWLARDYSIGQQSSKAAQTWTTNSFSPSCEGVWGGGILTPLNFQPAQCGGWDIHHPCGRKVERNPASTSGDCQPSGSSRGKRFTEGLRRSAGGPEWLCCCLLEHWKGNGLVYSHLFFMILYLIHFMRNLILLVTLKF